MIAAGPLLGQDVQEARPVQQAEAVDQAGRAVAERRGALQALAGRGASQGVLGGGRVGAGDPEAVGLVAVALLRYQHVMADRQAALASALDDLARAAASAKGTPRARKGTQRARRRR
jgi:hypothetical protein